MHYINMFLVSKYNIFSYDNIIYSLLYNYDILKVYYVHKKRSQLWVTPSTAMENLKFRALQKERI